MVTASSAKGRSNRPAMASVASVKKPASRR